MENNQPIAPVPPTSALPKAEQVANDSKPLIALILGIIGFIFALPQVKWLSALVILMLIASLILGFISLKPGKKARRLPQLS